MKAPNSLLNTHIKSVKGLLTVGDITNIQRVNIDIRCTSEIDKETISLTYRNIQMLVDVKHIEQIIEEARKDRKDKA